MTELAVYGGLFLTAFLAATILPGSSEVLLAGLLAAGHSSPVALVAVATVANTLGSLLNWLLGRGIVRFRDRPWFPVSAARLAAAERQFNRYGVWSLLFAWVPVIGDPLTVVAGMLRVPVGRFLLLVAFGKAARYAAIAAGIGWWVA